MKLSELKEGDVFTSTKTNGKIYKLLEDPNPKKKTVRVKNLTQPRLNSITKLQDMEVRTSFDCEDCGGKGTHQDFKTSYPEQPKDIPCPFCEGTGKIDLKTM